MGKRRSREWYRKHPRNKYWRKKAHEAWREQVYAITGGCCAVCGRRGRLDPHHILGKGAYPRYRFAVENGLPLCRFHHRTGCRGHISAHGTPRKFDEWLKEHYVDKWKWLQSARLDADEPSQETPMEAYYRLTGKETP